ncbi:DMT family transporter [Ferrimonas aestuarii]|uniref:DMT family transporter n=1 Tax=Ferrimonas aestuarii TaxID=2569539 RepID=A0A4U1BRZ5_9GAMM|nr:DMT family transporter [Ferrimonas aestuarii]TKB57346.1 DMT family transporter [Ferrimonas aestuarii]
MTKSAYLFPIATVIAWAGNGIVSKISVDMIAPGSIAFYRWLIAASLLAPFVLPTLWRQRALVKKHFFKLSILGGLGMVVLQTLTYVAAQTTSATHIALIGSVVPMMTMLWSLFLLRETPTQGMLVGSLMSFLGLAVLLTNGHPLALFDTVLKQGDLLLLIGALSYGLYGVLIKRWNLPFSTWPSLFLQMAMGALWLLPVFLTEADKTISTEALPLVLFAALIASLFATFSWLRGIELLGASKCTAFLNLNPVIGTLLAVLLLGEHLSLAQVLGGGLTLIGVYVAQKLKAPIRTKHTPAEIG